MTSAAQHLELLPSVPTSVDGKTMVSPEVPVAENSVESRQHKLSAGRKSIARKYEAILGSVDGTASLEQNLENLVRRPSVARPSISSLGPAVASPELAATQQNVANASRRPSMARPSISSLGPAAASPELAATQQIVANASRRPSMARPSISSLGPAAASPELAATQQIVANASLPPPSRTYERQGSRRPSVARPSISSLGPAAASPELATPEQNVANASRRPSVARPSISTLGSVANPEPVAPHETVAEVNRRPSVSRESNTASPELAPSQPKVANVSRRYSIRQSISNLETIVERSILDSWEAEVTTSKEKAASSDGKTVVPSNEKTATAPSVEKTAASSDEKTADEESIRALQADISKASKEAQDLQEQISKTADKLAPQEKLKANLAVSRWKYAFLCGAVSKLDEECQTLLETIGIRDTRIAEMQNEIAALSQQLQGALSQLERYQAQVTELEIQLEKEKEENSAAQELLKEEKVKSDELQHTLSEANARFEQMKVSLLDTEAIAASQTNTIALRQFQLEQTEASVKSLQQQLEIALSSDERETEESRKLMELHEYIRQKEEAFQCEQREFEETKESLTNTESLLAETKNTLSDTEHDLADTRDTLAQVEADNAESLKQLDEALSTGAELELKLVAKEQLKDELEQRLAEQEEMKAELDAHNKALSAQIEQAAKGHEIELEQELSEKELIRAEMEKENLALKEQIDSQENDIEVLKLQLAVDRNTISQLQQNVDKLQQNVDSGETIKELRGQMNEVLEQFAEIMRSERHEVLASATEKEVWLKEVLDHVSGQVTKILDEVKSNSGGLSHDGLDGLSKTVGQIVAAEVSRVGLHQSDTSDCDRRVASIVATIVAQCATHTAAMQLGYSMLILAKTACMRLMPKRHERSAPGEA
ncbi:hypothetical protein CYMTET_10729 [Cymbomonas tetramitiformis]|uniref:Uncharacterized protein n=1 Tax=Cymbomonas tetramitiformis TaxID=36881 RepID=A0AAE0GNK9_9CHLO|nr:hypothetical protein CYMTET_10729 [Cymbomonas tetramitiformis]